MLIKITEKMRKFITKQNNLGYIGTCSDGGRPNIAPKALLGIGEDTILYGDLFMDRTAENIIENNRVAIAVIDPFQCSGYQFKGQANIYSKGAAFEYATKKFAELGFDEPVHAIELSIDEIFYFEQGPEAKMEAA